MEGWQETTLGECVELLTGFPFSSAEYVADVSAVRLLRGDNIVPGRLRWADAKRWHINGNTALSKYLLNQEDVVIAMDRTWVSDGLKVAVIGKEDLPSLLVQRVARLRSNGRIKQKLISQLVSDDRFKRHVMVGQKESAVPHISANLIKQFPIFLPPLAEQETIYEILSCWDEAICSVRNLIAAIKNAQQEMYRNSFGRFSDTVCHKRAEEIFSVVSFRGNSDLPLLSATQEMGVVPRDMLEGRVMSPEGNVSTYKLVEPGDFVISLRSFQGGIEFSKYRGLVSPAYTVLRSQLPISADFYRHFFKSYIFIERYLRIAVIGIRDGKQISIPDFLSVRIPYPEISEQEAIGQKLNILELRLQKEINLLRAFEKQKRALMQKLLTGKIRAKVK